MPKTPADVILEKIAKFQFPSKNNWERESNVKSKDNYCKKLEKGGVNQCRDVTFRMKYNTQDHVDSGQLTVSYRVRNFTLLWRQFSKKKKFGASLCFLKKRGKKMKEVAIPNATNNGIKKEAVCLCSGINGKSFFFIYLSKKTLKYADTLEIMYY